MAVKILVVDDSSSDRLIITSILDGYDILQASNGLEAICQIEEQEDIDLMVLDLNMPGMDGFQVLEILKSNQRYKNNNIRTIILTNYDELDNEIRGLKLGAIDYIRKPIQMESLKARIDVHAELTKIQHAFEQKLHDQGLTFETIFDQAPIGIAISFGMEPSDKEDKDFVRINPTFENITGRTSAELINTGWAAITHPDDLAEDLENYKKLQSGEIKSYSMDKRYIKPDGSTVWIYMVAALLSLSDPHRYNHICLIQDISKRKEMEEALAESERSKSILLSHLPGMAYRCSYNRDWTMQYVSEGCQELTGYSPADLTKNANIAFNDLIVPEYHDLLWQEWKQVLAARSPFSYEYEIIAKNNKRKWVLELGQGIFNNQGGVEALEGIILDISDRKRIENDLKYNNEHDTWTGLFNRRYLEILLKEDVKKTKHNRALVGINLSSLHSLSLIYGFQYTWNLIKKTADVLKTHITSQRLLFSMYENQFAFYIRKYQDKNELIAFCETLADTLESLLTIERIDAGIGVVEIDKSNELSIDQLMKGLMISSENAIEDYDDFSYSFFDRQMEAEVMREDEIKRELGQIAAGISCDRLFLLFQPIFDLKENQITGFEALARLNIQQFGLVSPIEFIPLAEESKLIIPLGDSIIHQAFEFLRTLTEHGYDSINISINISAIQLLRKNFSEKLFQLMDEMQVDPKNVNLELTESIFAANYQEINSILQELQKAGIGIAIDDFGTGYSSLARESELNVDCLKIDRSFINKLNYVDADQAISGDIISMAHKLGHTVIAEGVEHDKQLQYLKAYGCDKIQGYLISKPITADEALKLLEQMIRA